MSVFFALFRLPGSKNLSSIFQIHASLNKNMFSSFCRVFDRNGDGFISKAEFKHCMMHFGEQVQGLHTVYKISSEGLKTDLLQFTDEEVEEMISDADSNQDGRIDYSEFSQMILREIHREEMRRNRDHEKKAAMAMAALRAASK